MCATPAHWIAVTKPNGGRGSGPANQQLINVRRDRKISGVTNDYDYFAEKIEV